MKDEDICVVVRQVDEISIYTNGSDEIVVYQVANGKEHVVVFPKQYAKAVANKIMELSGQ